MVELLTYICAEVVPELIYENVGVSYMSNPYMESFKEEVHCIMNACTLDQPIIWQHKKIMQI